MNFYRKYYRTTTLLLLASVFATLSHVQDSILDSFSDTYCHYLAPHAETVLHQLLPDFISTNLGVLLFH